MYGDQQATMPSFTSYPTTNPNPDPNPPNADASLYQYSHGFDGSEMQSAFELEEAAASQNEAAGNIGDEAQHVVNTTSQPESIETIQCEVCNITCTNRDIFEKHTQGKKHMKNMQKIAISSVIGPKVTPPNASATSVGELENKKHLLLQNGASVDKLLYCETCNVVCNNQDAFQAHLAGRKHSSKAIMQGASTNDVFNPTSNKIHEARMNPDPLRCELCKISCTSFELLNTHLSGKKHLKKLRESEQISDLPLTFVTSLDTQRMQNQESTEGKAVISHEGKKHHKNLEKSEKGIGPNPEPGMLQDEGKEEDKVVNLDGSNRKTKRVASDEELEAKRQKILQGGAASNGLRTCTVCNVVCSSPAVYNSHLAGKKHAAMAVKQAETGLTGQET
ncbi:unnamed protein product [Lactuca virosa]|uniref:C2H2-type domain-containing protein n=1 Tax=Lactuca virosa TaxID=75947 RepID=A0AAU9MP76_9ASTR|nr:unnamed protein product [Lactuca virosa]